MLGLQGVALVQDIRPPPRAAELPDGWRVAGRGRESPCGLQACGLLMYLGLCFAA